MWQELGIALDGVTFVVLLWNWSVVGVVATFALPLPLRLKQGAGRLLCCGAAEHAWHALRSMHCSHMCADTRLCNFFASVA